MDVTAFSLVRIHVHRPRASGSGCPAEFFDNLSRFAGVSEVLAEREPAGEIPSEVRGIFLSRFAGVSEVLAEHEPAGEILSEVEGS